MTNLTNQYAPLLHQKLCKIRRRIAKKSLKQFAQIYFSNICEKPFSLMHINILFELDVAAEDRKERIAIAAPRGHAKSTIVSLVYVLWCLLYNKEKLILLISNTEDQAVKFLRDIREQIESNPLFIRISRKSAR